MLTQRPLTNCHLALELTGADLPLGPVTLP